MNESPQGPSLHRSGRVPVVLTVRADFTKDDNESLELSRLLLYRLMVLEAALERVRELMIAANAPVKHTDDHVSRVNSVLNRHGWE